MYCKFVCRVIINVQKKPHIWTVYLNQVSNHIQNNAKCEHCMAINNISASVNTFFPHKSFPACQNGSVLAKKQG